MAAAAKTKSAPAANGGADDKVRIRFDAEPHHRLIVDDKTTIRGGKEASVSKERAEYLVRNGFSVTVVDGTKFSARWPHDDAELDAIAARVGLNWPATAESASLSIEEKVAALEAAGHTPESVA